MKLTDILENSKPLSSQTIKVRVRYGETDQMGVAYYGSYLNWFETGRTELLRKLGIPYTAFEQQGFLLPVCEVYCRYNTPLAYDDEFELTTQICFANRFKVVFKNIITHNGDKNAWGGTLHLCTGTNSKLVSLPAQALEKIKNQSL